MNWYLAVLKKYADFNGRARRKEYWMFILFHIIVLLVLMGIGVAIAGNTENPAGMGLYFVYLLATFVPTIALSARRMHDIGKSGWFQCVQFIPFIGGIWFLILAVQNGDVGENEYGPDPKTDNLSSDSTVLDGDLVA